MSNKLMWITGRRTGKSTWLAEEAITSRNKAMYVTASTSQALTARYEFECIFTQYRNGQGAFGLPSNIGMICIDEVCHMREASLSRLLMLADYANVELRLAGTPEQYIYKKGAIPLWLSMYNNSAPEELRVTEHLYDTETTKNMYGTVPYQMFMSEYLGKWTIID